MLDVRRLRVLKEVAEQGSFSAAADSLSYTQSAVSQQIAALEREAGTPLVERNARGVRLTESGRALVAHSEVILERLSAAEAELEAIAGLRGGRLRLASFATAGATLVPLAIARFSAAHPGVELSLVEAEPEDALPRVKSGELDIGLAFNYPTQAGSLYGALTDDLESVYLLDDPMSVALAPDHPFAARKSIRLSELSAERWIQCGAADSCGIVQWTACQRAGFTPHVLFETNDYNVAQGLVASGVAIALVPELALSNLREDIVIRPLAGRERPVRHIVAVVREGPHRSAASTAMLDILRRVASEYTRPGAAALTPAGRPADPRVAAARAG